MMAQTRPTLISAARRRRFGRFPARVMALALALVFGVVLSLGPASGPTPAHADTTCVIYPGAPACAPTAYTPAPLLSLSGALYTATTAQQQALANLAQQAVANTLQNHGLPTSDANAAQTWGRADAEAELWALLVQAIKAPAASRTPDQQDAVAWLQAVQRRQAVQAANDAGLEYVKWAGFDQVAYQTLLATNAGQGALQTFFTGTPLNRGNGGGYCTYAPPTPYQNDFSDRDNQTCFTPCTSIAGCIPNPPSYAQFVTWGAADANYAAFDTNDFGQAARDIGIGLGFGLGAAAGVTGLSLGSAALGGTAVFAAAAETGSWIFPFATATGVTVAGVAGLAAIVIAALAATVIDGINVFTAADLPGQLATLIAAAPAATPDLGAILGDPDPTRAKGLYSLFVGATLPTPRLAPCSINTPGCNAPAIPAAASSDLEFAISDPQTSTVTYAPTLTLQNDASGTTTTARVSGGPGGTWFVDQVNGVDVTQTLRLRYTDWGGGEQTAWLVHDPSKGYMFLSIADASAPGTAPDPSTCVAAGTCSYSPAIGYVGDNGNHYAAEVLATAPTVAPTFSANPTALSPVTFDAHGASPIGRAVTYQWQFEQDLSAFILDGSGNAYTYGAPVTGAQVSHTFATSGTFHVQLTATDAAGKVTVHTFTVSVAAAPVSVNWSPPGHITYGTPVDGALLNATASSNGAPVDGTYAYSVAGSPVTAKDSVVLPVGSYRLVVQFIPSGNPGSCTAAICAISLAPPAYQTPVPMSVRLVVDPAPLTVTVADASRLYGDGNPTFTASYSGLVNGDTSSVVSALRVNTSATTGSPVGAYALTPSGATATNYAITSVAGTLTVKPAPLTVTAADATKVYGDPNPAFTGTLSGLTNNDAITASYGSVATPRTPAGVYGPTDPHAIVPTLSDPGHKLGNYTVSTTNGTLTVKPAALTITANDQTTPYGRVPAATWTGSGWVNGESAGTLTTAPTCQTTVNNAAASATTPPGVYPGVISCQGAVDPNYAFTYTSGRLTIDPLLSLDEQGLPRTVPHQATLDGQVVTVPVSTTNVEVAYGSTHRYSFPATVTDPGSGAIYITTDAGYSGTVTANSADTASYQTVAQAVAAALTSGGIDSAGQATALTQQFNTVQQDVKAGATAQALADLHTFAAYVRAQAGKHVAPATAQTLLAAAQTVYASLGGTGAV